MRIRSCTCSSNLTDFLPIRQEFVFFTRGGQEGLSYPGWEIVHVRCSSIFEKMGCYHCETFVWWFLHKTPRFWDSENGKWLFGATKRKTSSYNIVRHPKMHMCAQYGHIITNYAAILNITLVVWPETHETST